MIIYWFNIWIKQYISYRLHFIPYKAHGFPLGVSSTLVVVLQEIKLEHEKTVTFQVSCESLGWPVSECKVLASHKK